MEVYLSNSTATVGQALTQAGDLCDSTGTLSNFRPTRHPFVCPPNTRGRFIQIMREKEFITLIEIEVFAWESDGLGKDFDNYILFESFHEGRDALSSF